MSVVDQIVNLYSEKGNSAYFGESVTETAHALQCAHLAETAGAGAELIVAALLHDIGHLLHNLGEDVAERGIDGRHEEGGAAWLSRFFGPNVVDPVRLHVAAKRYLCAVEPHYLAGLSAASRQSLHLQGGPMTPDEAIQFEQESAYEAAVAVRRWDDEAKIPDHVVPNLEHYRQYLAASLLPSSSQDR